MMNREDPDNIIKCMIPRTGFVCLCSHTCIQNSIYFKIFYAPVLIEDKVGMAIHNFKFHNSTLGRSSLFMTGLLWLFSEMLYSLTRTNAFVLYKAWTDHTKSLQQIIKTFFNKNSRYSEFNFRLKNFLSLWSWGQNAMKHSNAFYMG